MKKNISKHLLSRGSKRSISKKMRDDTIQTPSVFQNDSGLFLVTYSESSNTESPPANESLENHPRGHPGDSRESLYSELTALLISSKGSSSPSRTVSPQGLSQY